MKLATGIAVLALLSGVAYGQKRPKPTPMKPSAMTKAPAKAAASRSETMSKADWQKMYNQAEKLFAKKDADALFKYMTPDFTISMMGKTQNADDAKKGMKQWFAMMKTLHATMTVTKVSQKGDTATVTDNFRNTGMTMPDPKTHKSAKYVDVGTETATWVRMDGRWMMKKLVSVSEKMTMNGKPFKPNMGGG